MGGKKFSANKGPVQNEAESIVVFAKVNPQRSQSRRLPGNDPKALHAPRKDNPTVVPTRTKTTDRSSPSIRPNIGRTNSVGLDDLIAKAKNQIARIARRESYVTARHWDLSETLERIRSLCKKKGDWERALQKIGLRRQRAWEYRQYPKIFANRAEAAACPVLTANQLIKKAIKAEDAASRGSGADEDCFATPPWLLEVLRRDYGDFGLDAAASHGHAVADRYYTVEDDALQQDWAADCNGKPVFLNPPFTFGLLEQFVRKAYEESQRGATVVCVLPFYKSYPWFRDIVWEHAEVRQIQGQVIFQGFDSQEGKCAGNKGRMQFDTVVAVFRPEQRGCLGPYIDRLGEEPEQPVTMPIEEDLSGNDSAYPHLHIDKWDDDEWDEDDEPVIANGGFPVKNNKKRSTLIGAGNSDDYYTPAYALGPLLPYLPKDKVIWESAWGTGELAKHLRAAGYQVVGRTGMDFLKEEPDQYWDILVSNPPYSFADEFLERAYSLGKPFAFLLPVYALGGGARVLLYLQHDIEILVPSKRVNYYRNDNLPNGASFHSAWFCWHLLPKQLMPVKADW